MSTIKYDEKTDFSWREGMARAYDVGKKHGEMNYMEPYAANGFDACYWQGWGHGARRCACPERLAGKRDSRPCGCCGHRRYPEE